MATLQEGFWDNLLDFIQDRTVVPVIGPELVTVRESDRDVPLYRWLAQLLAADLELPTAELAESFDLNEVVSLHLRRRGEREELYAQIHRMLRNAALTPPESLRALAGIPGFDLFVSLTFDSLLADAIGAARTGGGPRAQQIAYSPNTVRDLACPKAELRQPVVFHLLGRASASPSVRRLELTHDVLTRVVKESRDSRRAREAEETVKVRERAALEQQKRNRRNAALVLAGALVVIVLIVLAGWSAWEGSRARARAAALLHEAERMRLLAEADQLQAADYAAALLVNLESVRAGPTPDAQTGLRRRFLSHPHLAAFLAGHKEAVSSAAFSPDGKRLASGSADKTVIPWDVQSRKPLETLVGHKDVVESVAYSPDGKLLASASLDHTVILWETDLGVLMADACSTANRNLTC